ncbi:MAG TPA: sensor histidine kinase [Bacillales bacterium]|nr:sensor histidine kinase [Bacillales bacterium]
MKEKKLTSIRWRLVKFSAWACVTAAFFLVVVLLEFGQIQFLPLLSENWIGIPLVALLIALVLAIGALFGYLSGNELKKRFESLMQSILAFERGNYGHRVEALGDDEIGIMGDHLNQMAERVEKQVASLQKLSTEKAEWQEQLKKTAVSEERQRLARELHDAVSQQLFAISMMTSAVLENMDTADERVKKQMAAVEKMAGDAQNEMRALLLHLRPATLEGKGLKEGVEELLAELAAKQPIDIRWEVADLPGVSKGIEDHLFRIVQEALSNVFRHSHATTVTVRLGITNRQIFLRIFDNGVGFDMGKPRASSYGLQSIQERVNEIGGVAEIISFPGKGTQIEVKVPITNDGRGLQ